MNLKDLMTGKTARILSVNGQGANRQHFLDMGVIPGATIRMIKTAPMGDPIEYKLHGYDLTLRKSDAENIEVELTEEEPETNKKDIRRIKAEHPGLGESGIKYHDKKTETALSDNTKLTFALVGNQNAGKTTLFNQLTGSNQHVGNFPGVTVDRKDGQIRKHPETLITDLPGIYSLSPYSPEEIVSRNFVLDEKPLGIINVVDATSIDRGLYLTMQLLETDIPMVLALNMMDEVRNNGGYVDINSLEKELGIPVVAISASKNEGIDELIEHAIHVCKYQEKPSRQDYCDVKDLNGAVHRCLHSIMAVIEDHAEKAGLPLRFCASKVADHDKAIIDRLNLDPNEIETIEHLIKQMEDECGLDSAAAIADMRYKFIMKTTKASVIRPNESIEHLRSKNIDKVLTGKYTAIPSFVLIMALVFYITFGLVGPVFENLIAGLVNWLTLITDNALTNAGVNPVLHSLIINGIFEGVGSILSFLPIIVILFFFLSILEDSGYMARVAFVMDKLLRKLGLSGRSIVPMLVGFGCTVPAVMSARTLPSERDRKMTILLVPFMSCSAKLPIYAFFAAAFFKKYAALVMTGLYFIGILISIIIALIFKNTIFKGEAVPFVMELPNYRLPSAKNVAQLLWEKAKDFLTRAFTVIFIATILIWLMQNFSFSFNLVADSKDSILAGISSFISPIFRPLGFEDWRITTSLFTGFMAKESVVSTLNILFGSTEALMEVLTPLKAFSLLIFCLLYSPCVAAVGTIRKEMGISWALGVIIFTTSIAWICSFIFYALASIF